MYAVLWYRCKELGRNKHIRIPSLPTCNGLSRVRHWSDRLAQFHAPRRPPHTPSPARSVRHLGALAVRRPRVGQHRFEALGDSYPSDALLRDARSKSGLLGHLWEICFAARGIAARVRLCGGSTGVVLARRDSRSDSRVDITPPAGYAVKR